MRETPARLRETLVVGAGGVRTTPISNPGVRVGPRILPA